MLWFNYILQYKQEGTEVCAQMNNNIKIDIVEDTFSFKMYRKYLSKRCKYVIEDLETINFFKF